MTLEAIERGERRVLIDYDEYHDYPSDWDDIWGSFVWIDSFRSEWKGRQYYGIDDANSHWNLSDEIAQRYLRIFHDVLATEVEYARGDFGWVVTKRSDDESVEEWERRHSGNVDVWTTYLSGDVYRVTLQERVSWMRTETTGTDADMMETWEFLDALGGVAPFDYAMSMAEATLDSGYDAITYP